MVVVEEEAHDLVVGFRVLIVRFSFTAKVAI